MRRLAVSLALLAANLFSASDDAAIQSTFVKPYVEALRSKDRAALERFIHPAVRACINPETKAYFDFTRRLEADADTSGVEHVTKLAPLKTEPPAALPPDGFTTPVRPVYELQIDFDRGELLLLYLAEWKGSWYEVYPCPNAKGMAYFGKQKAEIDQLEKKAAQLVAGLPDPLRRELTDLLRRQEKSEAIQKYRQVSGADIRMAVLVVDLLAKK